MAAHRRGGGTPAALSRTGKRPAIDERRAGCTRATSAGGTPTARALDHRPQEEHLRLSQGEYVAAEKTSRGASTRWGRAWDGRERHNDADLQAAATAAPQTIRGAASTHVREPARDRRRSRLCRRGCASYCRRRAARGEFGLLKLNASRKNAPPPAAAPPRRRAASSSVLVLAAVRRAASTRGMRAAGSACRAIDVACVFACVACVAPAVEALAEVLRVLTEKISPTTRTRVAARGNSAVSAHWPDASLCRTSAVTHPVLGQTPETKPRPRISSTTARATSRLDVPRGHRPREVHGALAVALGRQLGALHLARLAAQRRLVPRVARHRGEMPAIRAALPTADETAVRLWTPWAPPRRARRRGPPFACLPRTFCGRFRTKAYPSTANISSPIWSSAAAGWRSSVMEVSEGLARVRCKPRRRPRRRPARRRQRAIRASRVSTQSWRPTFRRCASPCVGDRLPRQVLRLVERHAARRGTPAPRRRARARGASPSAARGSPWCAPAPRAAPPAAARRTTPQGCRPRAQTRAAKGGGEDLLRVRVGVGVL